MSHDEGLDLDRLGRDAQRFRRRVVELVPEEELRVDTDLWRDSVVFLESGEIDVECHAGECRRFSTGAVLCFTPRVRLLRNRCSESARLIAISRRAPEPGRPAG